MAAFPYRREMNHHRQYGKFVHRSWNGENCPLLSQSWLKLRKPVYWYSPVRGTTLYCCRIQSKNTQRTTSTMCKDFVRKTNYSHRPYQTKSILVKHRHLYSQARSYKTSASLFKATSKFTKLWVSKLGSRTEPNRFDSPNRTAQHPTLICISYYTIGIEIQKCISRFLIIRLSKRRRGWKSRISA